jgi:hypothetical protein
MTATSCGQNPTTISDLPEGAAPSSAGTGGQTGTDRDKRPFEVCPFCLPFLSGDTGTHSSPSREGEGGLSTMGQKQEYGFVDLKGRKIDHGLIETAMTLMTEEERWCFWTFHIDVMRRALADGGVAPDVAEKVLGEHFRRVRSAHKARLRRARRVRQINFSAPPELGTSVRVGHREAVLVAVEPIKRRRDGAPSFRLTWEIAGRRATSGLVADSLVFEREGSNDA